MHANPTGGGHQELKESLLLRSVIYKLLGKIYYEAPERGLFESVLEEDPFSVLPGQVNAEIEEGLSGLAAWRRENAAGLSDGALATLRWDHTRLFVGPYRLPAPPWESVYRSEDRLTFGHDTLEVRKIYAAFGLESARLGREPEDHIGLELEFMHHLCRLAIDALNEAKSEVALTLIEAQRGFLHDHLLAWAPAFCTDVSGSAETSFFQAIARFTAGFLKLDAEALDRQAQRPRL